MKITKNKIIYILIPFIIFLILVISNLTKRSQPSYTPNTVQDSSSQSGSLRNESQITNEGDVEIVYNTSKEWNDEFDKQIKIYENTRNAKAEDFLAEIRMNSPIVQKEFSIEYSYKTATYTITVNHPAKKNQAIAIQWLNNKGVTEQEREKLRFIWQEEKTPLVITPAP